MAAQNQSLSLSELLQPLHCCPSRTIDHIEVWIDPNIYKNGMAVIIPSTGGMTGLDTASAVGAFGGDPARGLEVLDTLDEPALLKAKALLKEKKVVVHLLEKTGLHIRTIITSGQDTGRIGSQGASQQYCRSQPQWPAGIKTHPLFQKRQSNRANRPLLCSKSGSWG